MEYVIKIDWPKQEITSMGLDNRMDALRYLKEMETTFERLSDATEGDHGAAFGVTSRRQGEHTIGIRVHVCNTALLTYELVGADS